MIVFIPEASEHYPSNASPNLEGTYKAAGTAWVSLQNKYLFKKWLLLLFNLDNHCY